jgi:hypothetical protein
MFSVLLDFYYYVLVTDRYFFLSCLLSHSNTIEPADAVSGLANVSLQVWSAHLSRRLGRVLDAGELVLTQVPVGVPAVAFACIFPSH